MNIYTAAVQRAVSCFTIMTGIRSAHKIISIHTINIYNTYSIMTYVCKYIYIFMQMRPCLRVFACFVCQHMLDLVLESDMHADKPSSHPLQKRAVYVSQKIRNVLRRTKKDWQRRSRWGMWGAKLHIFFFGGGRRSPTFFC